MARKIILLTGGGTGGHIYPLVAVAQKLIKVGFGSGELQIKYLGPMNQFNAVLSVNYGVRMHNLLSVKFRRYFSLLNLIDIPKFFLALAQALWKVFWIMPNVIFSKGGTGALPVVLAGWFYRVPIVIHESDAVPGLTNLVSGRFARRIAVGFDSGLQYFDPNKAILTGNPVREELLGDRYAKDIAKEELGFKGLEPLVVFLGGSQGSKRLNDFVLLNLRDLLSEAQILHQAGWDNFSEIEKLSRAALLDLDLKTELEHRYKVVPYFLENLRTVLIAADLVVTRAGGGAIFELAAFGKPALLIPLPESAGGHQRVNAYEFAKAGGGVVIEEDNLFKGIFLGQFREILKNEALRKKMELSSAKFFKPEAAELLAQELINLI